MSFSEWDLPILARWRSSDPETRRLALGARLVVEWRGHRDTKERSLRLGDDFANFDAVHRHARRWRRTADDIRRAFGVLFRREDDHRQAVRIRAACPVSLDETGSFADARHHLLAQRLACDLELSWIDSDVDDDGVHGTSKYITGWQNCRMAGLKKQCCDPAILPSCSFTGRPTY